MFLRDYTIKRLFIIPSLLTNVSAVPGETWTQEIAFSVPRLENDSSSASSTVDNHQPILIILHRQGHIIKYSVQILFLV